MKVTATQPASCHLPLMGIYATRIVHRDFVAHETLRLQVERPVGFTFEAGQYVDLTVFNAADRDALGPMRSLSIASAPGAATLEFVMRVRDTAFKRNLATLPIGTELHIEGPLDDLGLRADESRELVFIAGGVGIAPFMSVIRDAAAIGRPLRATLFYSNRRQEDAAYLDELWHIERQISGFSLVPVMTQAHTSRSVWRGETSRLGIDLLKRYLPSLADHAYYLVGSPFLISEMRRALIVAGVPDADIGLELYAGY